MVAPARVEIGPYLYSDPNFRDGKVCITGTGMSLNMVASLHRQGYTVDEIWADYPHIPMDAMRAAVAYYSSNRAAIDDELDREREEADRIYQEWKREHPSPAR